MNDIQPGRYYLVTDRTYDGKIEYTGMYVALITKIEGGTVHMIDAAGSGWENQDDLASMVTDEDVRPIDPDLALDIRCACVTHHLERVLHGRETVARELAP